jgi:acylphosphatase
MKSKVHVIISGRVQGVWFRSSIKDKAEQLGITGWVKNTSDGNVEALFEGDEKIIKEMLEWCDHGPPLAKVDNVEVEKQPVSDEFDQFSFRY